MMVPHNLDMGENSSDVLQIQNRNRFLLSQSGFIFPRAVVLLLAVVVPADAPSMRELYSISRCSSIHLTLQCMVHMDPSGAILLHQHHHFMSNPTPLSINKSGQHVTLEGVNMVLVEDYDAALHRWLCGFT
ncbi:hypothetical protein RJT34_22917 [Clitoria ternatea]|uniref:Uncharacterized protein n=1 Tax=Clitoria ternatea TaxID=43366 RepID=A0AAN9IEG4_CLITE